MNKTSQIPDIPSNIGEAVLRTIRFLRESEGSSYADIEKYLLMLYRDSEDKPDSESISNYLNNAVDKGILLKLVNGNYKIKNTTKRRRRKHYSSERHGSPDRLQTFYNVQHFDFSTPVRSQKDIVSPCDKSLEKCALQQTGICSFCDYYFNESEHLNHEQRNLREDYHADEKHRVSNKKVKRMKYTVNDRTKSKSSEDDNLVMKKNLPKEKLKTDYDRTGAEIKHRLTQLKKKSKKVIKETLDTGESKVKTEQEIMNCIQKHFPVPESTKLYSNEKTDRRDHFAGKKISRSRCYELKQVCIHAFVHEPSCGECDCGKCVELGKKDSLKLGGRKQISDTDATSTLNSSDINILTKRTKIISEEDYKRKKDKLKKKLRTRFGKESTTITDSSAISSLKKFSEEQSAQVEGRSILTDIDEKCTCLQKVLWASFFILLFLLLIAGGNLACCVNYGGVNKFHCLPKILRYSVSF